jgi:hypothetical protein
VKNCILCSSCKKWSSTQYFIRRESNIAILRLPFPQIRIILPSSLHSNLNVINVHFIISLPYSPGVLNTFIFHRRAGIAQWYSAGLRAGWSGVRFSAGAGKFSLHHRVQAGLEAHPSSYPMGARGSFPGCKAAAAWSWPPSSSTEVKECVELYLHSPNTPWCCQLYLYFLPFICHKQLPATRSRRYYKLQTVGFT